MDKLATASINNFASRDSTGRVSPESDFEQFIQNLIDQSVQKAVQVLQDRIESLEGIVASQGKELVAMRLKLVGLESLQESEISRVCVDIAQDRRRLSALENPVKEPGKTETARAEKIEKYLASRPDHRATFETLKGHLGIDNDLLGIAIRSLLPSGKYAIIKTPGDKRKRTLIMLPR